ncbi:unnamed protein product [Clonostachys rosea]|uniref:Uncharacterized protein n=1 Tax=Bionectria ochroleuca TaxID=29856 RepID=A0ABY6TWQ4_BIOOC|nr:unnamed protein product [Clonostachys rosea]
MAPRSTPMPTPEFRPRSSSGTNLGSRKHEYDKRKSRDDLYLMTMTSQKQSFKPFHVPIRSTSPTHDSGSLVHRTPPAGPGVSSNSTSNRPVHPGGQDPVAIGMALGSPAHPHSGHSLSPMNPPPVAIGIYEIVANAPTRKWPDPIVVPLSVDSGLNSSFGAGTNNRSSGIPGRLQG